MGGTGNDVLDLGEGSDRLFGGEGNDFLVSGPSRLQDMDFLDGGAGDDTLMLGYNSIAIGGSGADKFVILPAIATPVSNPLAVLLDFAPSEGDRLMFAGPSVSVVSVTAQDNILAANAITVPIDLQPVAGVRIGLDFNGDGKEDNYILVSGFGNAALIAAPTSERSIPPPPTPLDLGWSPGLVTHDLIDQPTTVI